MTDIDTCRSDEGCQKADSRPKSDLDELLTRIPAAEKWAKELRALGLLLLNRRQARIVVLGRPGSGKSALFEALLGVPELPATKASGGAPAPLRRQMRWLDASGLGQPTDGEDLLALDGAILAEPPDVVLVLRAADALAEGLDDELADLDALLALLSRADLPAPRVVGLLTKADMLSVAPGQSAWHVPGHPRVPVMAAAVAEMRRQLVDAKVPVADVLPVAARPAREVSESAGAGPSSIEAVAEAIFACLPEPAQIETARAFPPAEALRRRLAVRIVGATTGLSLLIGASPLPIGDIFILLPLQSSMLTSIAYLGARRLRRRSVARWLGSMGAGVLAAFGLREGMRALLKLVPGLGNGASGAVAAGGTWTIGMAAIRYFIDGGSLGDSRAALQTPRPGRLLRRQKKEVSA